MNLLVYPVMTELGFASQRASGRRSACHMVVWSVRVLSPIHQNLPVGTIMIRGHLSYGLCYFMP
jgi:hypothetical protein